MSIGHRSKHCDSCYYLSAGKALMPSMLEDFVIWGFLVGGAGERIASFSVSSSAARIQRRTEVGLAFTPLATMAFASSGLESLTYSSQTSSAFGHKSQPLKISFLASASCPATSSYKQSRRLVLTALKIICVQTFWAQYAHFSDCKHLWWLMIALPQLAPNYCKENESCLKSPLGS